MASAMRRAAPTAGLSPQLVKHFAIATVSITALLALFATGEDWGAQAQLEEVEARNRLAAAEAEKLGKKEVLAKLKIRERSGSMGVDGGGDMGSGGGGGGGGGGSYEHADRATPRPGDYAVVKRKSEADAAPPQAHQRAAAPPGLAPELNKDAKSEQEKKKPTDQQIDAMLEASSQRSGRSSPDD